MNDRGSVGTNGATRDGNGTGRLDPVRVILVESRHGGFGTVETWGLADFGLPELEMRDVRRSLLPQAGELVQRIADYLVAGKRPVTPGQTLIIGGESIVRLRLAESEGRSGEQVMAIDEVPEVICPLCEGADHVIGDEESD